MKIFNYFGSGCVRTQAAVAMLMLIATPGIHAQNLAQGQSTSASSYTNSVYQPSKAVDGDASTTRWKSDYTSSEWIYVDLGQSYTIGQVVIEWAANYALEYDLQVSSDASSWTTIYSETSGDGGTDDITGLNDSGRYVRMLGLDPATAYGFSIWELEVYEATGGGGGGSTISEDFSSSADNFTEISGGTWNVSSGRYVLSSPASSGTTGVLGNISVHDTSLTGDFELSATLRITGTGSAWNDAAIVFGYQDSSNYYYASLNESNDDYTKGIFKVVSGTPTQLADISISVASDTDYSLEVIRSGSSITVNVNSSQVATASDSTFTDGKVGFGTYNDGAEFDDLDVTGTAGGGGGGGGGGGSGSDFGPDGTHWPDLITTPYMYDTGVENIVEVSCSWSAISSAISAVTSTEAAEGVLILVQPGSLTGNGAGSGSTPVLSNLGSTSWSKRVTVAPRDGWGTVTVSGGARIYRVDNVCFAGWDFDSLAFHATNRSAVAWTRVATFLSAHGASGLTLTDNEFIEVVVPDAALGGGDTVDLFSAGATEMSGYVFAGCYVAPRYRPSGSSAHTDTIQFEPTSGGCDVTDVTMEDCVFFASSNCAVQVNAIDGLVVDNCYMAGGSTSQSRYPFPAGADTGGANNCFNGGGVDMEAYDSYFIGGISGTAGSWIYADNTRTTYNGSNVPVSGSWIVDSTLDEDNPGMPAYPSTSYLDSVWNP